MNAWLYRQEWKGCFPEMMGGNRTRKGSAFQFLAPLFFPPFQGKEVRVGFDSFSQGDPGPLISEAHSHLGVPGSVEDIGVDHDLTGPCVDRGWSLDAELVISGAPAGLVVNNRCLLYTSDAADE